MSLFKRSRPDPPPRAPPDPVEIAVGYHQRTKHHFQRYAASLGYLDWANQPDPFRRFEGAPLLSLPIPAEDPVAYRDLYRSDAVPRRPVGRETLASLLFHSLALSAWKAFGGNRWALRVNPSSGNLHPTEGWLLLGGATGLCETPTLFHYAPKEHGLECRATLDRELWEILTARLPEGAFLAALSSIPWREGWKYGERAWRYCQHDAGHALAALRLAAGLLGWRLACLPAVDDGFLGALLGLDREDGSHAHESEVPDLLAVVVPDATSFDPGAVALGADLIPLARRSAFVGRANVLSEEHHPWELLEIVEATCRKQLADATARWPAEAVPTPGSTPPGRAPPGSTPPGNTPTGSTPPGSTPPGSARETPTDASAATDAADTAPTFPVVAPPVAPLATTILRQRRSAVSLDGRTGLPGRAFFDLLARLVPALTTCPWDAHPLPVNVHLGLFVHRVTGLPPGLYVLARDARQVDGLRASMRPEFTWETPAGRPEGLPLFLLQRADVRSVATTVSCTQDIAGDGAFSCGMLARFAPALHDHGAPLYRHLFWETGMVGQVLYLEAEAAGIRGTGIGCFFDDPVHAVFGLTDLTWQSLYHFTIGGAVEDLRLSTEPAYPARDGER